ncbi:alpha/beta hydrolase [Cloacibacillus sp. An23]|uniref:alpha/beta fold hydrolase n=1 Tax=Cloacibacillus sp. An23 TaxID=1965591 RepID=UPI000B38924E|nr:alpha/beta hydrolase [Cloacibacillus sp. An23]OUO93436.1 hypothetical protein B5F39_06950 [Cloacibacillus sp. An23]
MHLEADLYYKGNLEQEKVILFVPGTALSPEIYKNVRIPCGYEAVYLSWHDAPGYHSIESTADKILRLVRQHACRNIILVGHSSGGFIVMQTYFSLPNKSIITGILLCDTGCNTIGHINNKPPEEIKASWSEEKTRIAFLERCFSSSIDGETFAHLEAYSARISPQARIEPWVSQLHLDFTQRLCEISCPTMVVHGIDDKARPIAHAQQLAHGIRTLSCS